MNELAFDDPCLLFALRREAQAFLQEFRPQQRFPGSPCWARFCGPAWLTVLVLETGIGRPPTEKALDWLLSRPLLGNVPYRPRLVISAGFAGALTKDRRVGDIILADEVMTPDGKVFQTTWPGQLPAGEWRPPLHRGRLLTMDRIVGDPQLKSRLAQEHGTLAVDMESALVARHCLHHGVPFGCVRAISDDVHTAISPQLVSLLSSRRVSALRMAAALTRSPGLLPEFWRLAKKTRLAANELAKALGEVLTLTLPFGAEL